MEVRYNYSGAAIFWSYNIAALFFTAMVVSTLIHIPQSAGDVKAKTKRYVVLFSVLASVSFAVLSFNMLSVLIQSFLLWSSGSQSLSSKELPAAVWKWSLTSTLFQDFGEAIVENSARFLWTDSALLVTFSICLFMGAEGTRRNVPRLWAFFCLAEILPISFTQNLFYIALLRTPESRVSATMSPNSIPIGLVGAYFCCLLAAPSANGTWLIRFILLARIVLFTPLLFAKTTGAETPAARGISTEPAFRVNVQRLVLSLAVPCVLYQMFVARQDGYTLQDMGRALLSHPAVSALGCDLILSLISFTVWTAIQGDYSREENGAKSS